MSSFTRRAALALAIAGLGGAALAQGAWPSRPVKIIVPFGAGTGLDVMARAYAL